jgi:hypothetical protein
MDTQEKTRPGPQTIPHTSRQRITASDGTVLQRQYLFMPEDSWLALQRLCYASHKSGSQVIQHLISIADTGSQVKETNNEPSSHHRRK